MQFNISRHESLAEAKNFNNTVIDTAAGEARARYITSVPGQSETYLKKAADAHAYKAAGYPADTSDYPWMVAEVNATGNTAQVCADIIIAREQAWINIGSAIEQIRTKAKIDIENATTTAAANTITRTAVTTLENI